MAKLGEAARHNLEGRPSIDMPRSLRKVCAVRVGDDYKIRLTNQAMDQFTDGYVLNGHLYQDGLSICAMNHRYDFKVRFYRAGRECGFYVPGWVASALEWNGLDVLSLGVKDEHFLFSYFRGEQAQDTKAQQKEAQSQDLVVIHRKREVPPMAASQAVPAAPVPEQQSPVAVAPTGKPVGEIVKTEGKKLDKPIEYEGVVKPLRQWAGELGLQPSTLYNRIFRDKHSVEEAFTRPVRPYQRKKEVVAEQTADTATETATRGNEMGKTAATKAAPNKRGAAKRAGTNASFRKEFAKIYRADLNVEPVTPHEARGQQRKPTDMVGSKSTLGAEVLRLVARTVGTYNAIWEVRCNSCQQLNAVTGNALRSAPGIRCRHCKEALKPNGEIMVAAGQPPIAPATKTAAATVTTEPAAETMQVSPEQFQAEFTAKYNAKLEVAPLKARSSGLALHKKPAIDMFGLCAASSGSIIGHAVAMQKASGDRIWETTCGSCGGLNAFNGSLLRSATAVACRHCSAKVKASGEKLVKAAEITAAKPAAKPEVAPAPATKEPAAASAQQPPADLELQLQMAREASKRLAEENDRLNDVVAALKTRAGEAEKLCGELRRQLDEQLKSETGDRSYQATYYRSVKKGEAELVLVNGPDPDLLLAKINADPDLLFGAGYEVKVVEVVSREVKVRPQLKLN